MKSELEQMERNLNALKNELNMEKSNADAVLTSIFKYVSIGIIII